MDTVESLKFVRKRRRRRQRCGPSHQENGGARNTRTFAALTLLLVMTWTHQGQAQPTIEFSIVPSTIVHAVTVAPSITPDPPEDDIPVATSTPSKGPPDPPTGVPTAEETPEPSAEPSPEPSDEPQTKEPTESPTLMTTTESPTDSPTVVRVATDSPTSSPTDSPTNSPTVSPTDSPTATARIPLPPTQEPSVEPRVTPTVSPTDSPTSSPTDSPTNSPTDSPTREPTAAAEIPTPTTQEPTVTPTASPTASPTTAPPTDSPTASPTVSTTAPPTDSPTSSPTASPTDSPTAAETPPPTTRELTVEPTVTPNASPTASPTTDPQSSSPTVSPTSSPTASPTQAPSFEPSQGIEPSSMPTERPSPTPTVSPTATPTASPSTSPTDPPTVSPTASPTANPTASPSATTSSSPSSSPTRSPVAVCGDGIIDDDEEECDPEVAEGCDDGELCTPDCKCEKPPSPSPSDAPSPAPTTSSPSDFPTYEPSTSTPSTSESPTADNRPTASPTNAPTLVPTMELPLQKLIVLDNVMTIQDVLLPLTAPAEEAFERIAADTISNTIKSTLGEDQIQYLTVDVSYSQPSSTRMLVAKTLDSASVPLHDAQPSRVLEEGVLEFDTVIDIRSGIQTHDAKSYISTAFNDDPGKTDFMTNLKASGYLAFANVTTVSVSPGTAIPAARKSDTPDSTPQGINSIIVIAVVVSAFVALLVGVVFLFYRNRNNAQRRTVVESPLAVDAASQFDISSEIEVESGPNVSSLGDPVQLPYAAAADDNVLDTAESTSSISGLSSLDYEYRKAFGSQRESVSIAGSEEAEPISDDDRMLDYMQDVDMLSSVCFKVLAPPGTLGLVLETSAEGNPVVYTVKDSSPLSDQVRVGDRLVSINGVDVSGMLTTDVSRLIGSKRKTQRTFVFARMGEYAA